MALQRPIYTFIDYQAFYDWLNQHHTQKEGIFIQFDKSLKTSSLRADEALEIALIFGWIDGLIRRVDDQYYLKYFKKRANRSIWSNKNKQLVAQLIQQNRMHPAGYQAIVIAKENGSYDSNDSIENKIELDMIHFHQQLASNQIALDYFSKLAPSLQKRWMLSYFSLKKEESRQKRINTIREELTTLANNKQNST